MSSVPLPCPFCSPESERTFHTGDLVLGIWDAFPVSPGHALLLPKRHVASWFDATPEERRDLLAATDVAKAQIETRHRPAGYNIGINVGQAAGQTVFHLHVHVIPRYGGDADDPRGGVRHVLPKRANYLAGAGSLAETSVGVGRMRRCDPIVHREIDERLD